jgi:predicted ATPase/class 3 adenylate cyclase
MSDIRQWLDSLGLGQHADAFEQNSIEWRHLSDLDHEALKELGVQAMGHRMTLLRAIEPLDSVAEADPTSSKHPVQLNPSGEAERRQLTVMFCDLVGSVELGERMDIEDYRDLLGRFRTAVVGAVERYDGFVARHQGDGLLAYFGYPQAHEDDAERSIRAALDLVGAVEALEHPYDAEPKVRVGIATGPAVVGDVLATGASERSELAALGSTPNLAARLQGAAAPNGVLISETTQRLVEGVFAADSLGALRLKGLSASTTAYRVTGESSTLARVETPDSRRFTPLVGREVELALLLDRWKKVSSSGGQVVLIAAEPGVGKSRLATELVGRLRDKPFTRVTLHCSPYHADAPLHPVVGALRRSIGLGLHTDSASQLKRLEEWFDGLDLSSVTHVPLLAPLLAIPIGARYPALEIPDEERRKRVLRAIGDILVALSEQSPVLLFAEDLHWVDPTTQELLGQLVEQVRERPILGLFTFRPEYEPPWRLDAHVTLLTLNYLTRPESLALLRGMTGMDRLPESLLAAIISRTDGVPLYLEELSRSVLEQGAEAGTLIPETLRDALTARLDRLGEAKETVQLAAVLGRQFDTGLLRAIHHGDPSTVDASLTTLVEADLVHRRGEGGYEFKHALIRDTAYESMLKPKRQSIHAEVANALVELHAGSLEEVCESIAYHYAASPLAAKAAKFLVMSAEKAVNQYAHREAIELLGRALQQADGSSTPLEPKCTPAGILLRTAQSYYYLGEFAESTEVLEREVGRLDEDADPGIAAEWYFWMSHMVLRSGRADHAQVAAKRAIELAERIQDVSTMGKAHGLLVMAALHTGDLAAGETHGQVSTELLERAGELYWLGMTHFYLAEMWAIAGQFRTALTSAREAERLATRIANDRLKSYALFAQARTYIVAGDGEEALKYSQLALSTAPDPSSAGHASFYHAWGCLVAGRYVEASRLLPASADRYVRFHYPAGEAEALALAAESFFELGDDEQARSYAIKGAAKAQEIQFPLAVGLAKRTQGKLDVRQGRIEEGLKLVEEALAELESAGAMPEVARTHRVLSELYRQAGNDVAGREHNRLAQTVTLQSL